MSEAGAILAELRRKARLSQEALSEALDVNRSYVSMVETGRSKPSLKYLLRFAEVLHFPLADMLRAAGLVSEPAVSEAELAAMLAAYPALADVFEYARLTGQRGLLEHLERQAKLLIAELTAQGVDIGEPGGGADPANRAAGD